MPVPCLPKTLKAFPDGSLNVCIFTRQQGDPVPDFNVVLSDLGGHILFKDGHSHVFDYTCEDGRIESRFILDARSTPLPMGTLELHVLRDSRYETKEFILVERSPFLRSCPRERLKCYVLRQELPIEIGVQEMAVQFCKEFVSPPQTVTLGSYNHIDVSLPRLDLELCLLDGHGFNVRILTPIIIPGYRLTWAAW